jgi:hypothetical protein
MTAYPFLSLPLISATLPLSNSSLCSVLAKRPFLSAPGSGTYPASHAYQICQIANGRAGWPAEICIKRGHLSTRDSFSASYKITHHEETAGPDSSRRQRLHPTAWPRCLVDRALHRSAAEHAARPVNCAPRCTANSLWRLLPGLYTAQTHCALTLGPPFGTELSERDWANIFYSNN